MERCLSGLKEQLENCRGRKPTVIRIHPLRSPAEARLRRDGPPQSSEGGIYLVNYVLCL